MTAERGGRSGARWAVFFFVIALAEFLWLLREYESNLYLRRFLEESPLFLYGGIFSIIAVASIAAFIVGRLASAPALSRTGRTAKTLQGWAPVLVGGLLLLLWASVIGGRVGYTSAFSQFYLVGTLLVISISLMIRNPVLLRMAVRNIGRRKANFAIVISGLMIGTAMISGSLVTGDTLTDLFTKGSYYSYGYADEVVYSIDLARSGNLPRYNYFNYTLYDSLQESLASDNEAGPLLRGVTPQIVEPVSVLDLNSSVGSPGITLVGTHANASRVLGDFHDKNGRVISSNLADTEMILDERAAKDLNASIGDAVLIHLDPKVALFTIAGIAVEDERGLFGGMHLFLNLNAAQALADRPQQLNYIAITNTGGLRPSIQHSETVGLAANRTLNALQTPAGSGCKSSPNENGMVVTILCAYAEKKAGVDSAIESAQMLSTFFLTMSTFSIIAGVVLILNIFVMLAEERKSEMGMARAVGMKRSHLTKLFLFEGSNYAAVAALVGVFAGIGIAYGILYAFGQIITGFFSVDLSIVLASFTFTVLTLMSAFTAGLLITYGTIILTSWRMSKLNIIRAIRDIPEPLRGIRTYTVLSIIGILLTIAGASLNQVSFSMKSAVFYLTGTSLVIFGIGLILSRFLRNRFAFTLTGLALLVQWGVPQLSWTNPVIKNYEYGPELFFTGGIIMVLGAILVFTYNTDLILKATQVFTGLRKSLVPVFRIGLSYPNNKRFRTTGAVSMFALVIFTVTTISVITAEQTAALETQLDEFTGGYDIVTETLTDLSNFTQVVRLNGNLTNSVEAVIPFTTSILTVTDLDKNIPSSNLRIVGANATALGLDNFFTTNRFNMINMTSNYNSELEVWSAVTQNSSKVVWSAAFVSTTGPPVFGPEPEPGDTLLLADGTGRTARVEVVAILNGVYFDGIVSSDRLLRDEFGITTGTLAFIKVAESADPTQVSIILRRDNLRYGLRTLVIPVLVADFLEVGNAFLALFQGFLGLGLVVGIAGLGIISIRSVVERRREIGMLRALGFRRSMVLQTFLLENSYITLLGIVIGVVLGINLGYAISQSPGSQLPFVIPWVGILEIVGIAYGLAMLATVGSAFRAARIPPAEALRYTE